MNNQGKSKGMLRIIVIALIILAVYGAANSSKKDTNKDNGNKLTSTDKPTPTEKSTPTPTKTLDEMSVLIGETQKYGDNIELTVTKVVFSKWGGNLEGLHAAKDGYINCVVYMKLKNIGTGTLKIGDGYSSDYDWKLFYDEKYKYTSSWSSYSDFFEKNATVPALGTLEAVVNFEVPIEVKDNIEKTLNVEFSKHSIWGSDKIYWKLR